jgi:CRP-like cAMP-binding protein
MTDDRTEAARFREAMALKDRARERLDAGDHDAAWALASQGQALWPEDPSWEWLRGCSLHLRGNKPAAAAAYGEAIRRAVARGESTRALGYGTLLRELDPDAEVLQWLARWMAADYAGDDVPPPPPTPFFSELGYHEVLEVLSYAGTRTLAPGDALIEPGRAGDALFLVGDGSLRVELRTEHGGGTHPERLLCGPGDVVGEMAFFERREHHHVVRAETAATVLEIGRDDLEGHILPAYPAVETALRRLYRQRVVDYLLRVRPPFSALSPLSRSRLADACEWLSLAEGQTLITQDSDVHDLFLVKSGFVEVMRDDALVTVRHAGEFIGEVSLLRGAHALATVRAAGPVEAVRFPGAVVVEAVRAEPQAAQAFEDHATERLREVTEALTPTRDASA